MGGETAGIDDSCMEPDMAGVEENVDTKADQMHDGRGRVRTSSQVFTRKLVAGDKTTLRKVGSLRADQDCHEELK